jgi:heptosyltransferase-1
MSVTAPSGKILRERKKTAGTPEGLPLDETGLPGLAALPYGSAVLVVLFGRIGDVLFTLPSVAALKELRPDLSIDWLVEDRCADLLSDHPLLRTVFLFRRADFTEALRRRRILEAFRILGRLANDVRKERYAAVLDFQGLLKSGVATFLSRGTLKLGSPSTYGRMKEGAGLFSRQVPLVREGLHLVERHASVISALLKREVFPAPFSFGFTREERSRVQGLLGDEPTILLHPFASWETRNWPLSSWIHVARRLDREGFRLVLAGAGTPDQRSFHEALERLLPGRVRSLLGELSLRELAFAMSKTLAVLAVDSGPMHLASAVGAPVLALFGPTDPVRLGPFGPL